MSQAAPARNLSLSAALAEAEARFIAANPNSRARHEQAGQVMPGGNTRTVLHYAPFPLTMRRGAGSRLDDLDGHSYVDFLGEYTAGLFGHSHPLIMAAIHGALRKGLSFGGPNENEARLAALLCERFASIEKIRFCNSGSEANLMAVGTARAATGRSHILAFHGAYHGGFLSFAGGGSPLNAPVPVVLADYNDIEGTLDLIARHADTLAAVLIEPMMGSGGGIAADPEFLAALRAATERHGILLIFDEVMTSRLAPGGLQEKLGITPDLTALGKYIGGGMSFGAFGGKASLMARFDPSRGDAWAHAGTFNNNVLTMAAGVAAMARVYTPDVAAQLNAQGERFRDGLNAIGRARGVPMQACGIGSIMSIHWQSAPIRRPADTQATAPQMRALFHLEMIARGYYLARRGFISLSLPLQEADYAGFTAACEDFVAEYGDLIRAQAEATR